MLKYSRMGINSNIKLVRGLDKNESLLVCALMLFRYFDDPISKDTLWKKLHVYKKHSGLSGSLLTDLGILAINSGYQAEIYHYATHWWPTICFEENLKGSKALIVALKNARKEKDWADKKIIDKEIQFLKKGGFFITKVPNLQYINVNLANNTPVIANVNAANFYNNPKEKGTLSVLVYSKTGNNYLIRDPYLALEEIDKEVLSYSWLRNGGWMLVLKPMKDQLVSQEKFTFA